MSPTHPKSPLPGVPAYRRTGVRANPSTRMPELLLCLACPWDRNA
ncbi:hypothetical protein [Kribbella ginsengisoli]